MLSNIVFILCATCLFCVQAQNWGASDRVPELNMQNTLPSLTSSSAFQAPPALISASKDTAAEMSNIAKSVEKFGIELLYRVSARAQRANKDIMISPFSVWSLLLLMYEGSGGKTKTQLRNALHIDSEDEVLRNVYNVWSANLNINTSTIEVATLQAVFTAKTQLIDPNYLAVLGKYNAHHSYADFHDPMTYQNINDEANRATRGLIKYAVQPQEIYDARIFLLSSLYFKGQWKFPFNKTLTRSEPFYNDAGEVVGNVEMMVQENTFVYETLVPGLDGYVLELPYGQMDRLAMIVILPKRGFTLQNVVINLQRIGLDPILKKLDANRPIMQDDDVEVWLPKFTTHTDLKLNVVLNELGIIDLFSSSVADLSKMADNLFLNLCVHATKIIVDEEGTTAGAVTSAVLLNKASPPKFFLNKPFQYFIIDKSTNLMLFAGQVRNPSQK